MELYIFARFHAREGCEAEVAAALREVAAPSREEPGCLGLRDLPVDQGSPACSIFIRIGRARRPSTFTPSCLTRSALWSGSNH